MDRINEKLGAYLLQPGNSKQQLAKELDMSVPALNNRFLGQSSWKWDEICTVAQLLGVSTDELHN